jgi:hypothetical protein
MRKKDREITSFQEIIEVLDECDTIRLGLQGEEYPYVVPLSFGFEAAGDRIILYAHGAGEGYKHDLIAKNNHVCVEADVLRGYVAHGTGVTADYRSVIGFGTIEYAEDLEERTKGLQLLLDHCRMSGAGYSARECALRPITTVLKITLTSVSGKQRFSSR